MKDFLEVKKQLQASNEISASYLNLVKALYRRLLFILIMGHPF